MSSQEIRWASANGHSEVIQLLLLDDRVNPYAENNEEIREASQNGHVEVVSLLLQDNRGDPSLQDNRGDPSAADNDAIRSVPRSGHEVVRLLLQDDRVDPSALGNWAIREEFNYGHVEVVRVLLDDQRVLDCGGIDDIIAKLASSSFLPINEKSTYVLNTGTLNQPIPQPFF